jgi:hypothetical protein
MTNCVTKYYTKNTEKRTSFGEIDIAVVQVYVTSTILWNFFSNNVFTASDRGVQYVTGKWQCDGDENFKIIGEVTKLDGTKKNQTYPSKINDWIDTTTTTTTTTTEPTTTDTNQSIFPLKKGISAPEVVQLQNFLNNKGTGEKLVTDGIFGDLTYNKLVKYQEDNNLI